MLRGAQKCLDIRKTLVPQNPRLLFARYPCPGLLLLLVRSRSLQLEGEWWLTAFASSAPAPVGVCSLQWWAHFSPCLQVLNSLDLYRKELGHHPPPPNTSRGRSRWARLLGWCGGEHPLVPSVITEGLSRPWVTSHCPVSTHSCTSKGPILCLNHY